MKEVIARGLPGLIAGVALFIAGAVTADGKAPWWIVAAYWLLVTAYWLIRAFGG